MIFPTPQQMKTIEENSDKKGVTYRALMENAGGALAMLIDKIGQERDLSTGTVFLCGSGNNGGDGFVSARSLAENSLPVTVVLVCGDPSTELAALEYCELSGVSGVEVLDLSDNPDKVHERLSKAAVIVDAVFGTGFHGFLPPHIKECFAFAEQCNAVRIAADVPSGGDCLRGSVAEGTMKCVYTVAFGYKKVGMLMHPLSEYCGETIVADVGFTRNSIKGLEYVPELFEESDASALIPKRERDSHKGDFGRLLNVAGCSTMSGAAALSTKAALRSGAGLVTLASVESVINRMASDIPEATYVILPSDKSGSPSETGAAAAAKAIKDRTSVSIGSGLSVTDGTKAIVNKVIKEAACPVILDADGINCIKDNIDIIRDAKNKLIITPHAAELARLTGVTAEEAASDRLTFAVNVARDYNVIVVAKGVPTFVAGEGKVYVIPAGNPGLSRGGSGDVLTGIIAAFCAQGISPLEAAAAGVFVHGAAADVAAEELSETAMLPSDVIERLSFVFKKWNR